MLHVDVDACVWTAVKALAERQESFDCFVTGGLELKTETLRNAFLPVYFPD